LLAAGRLYYLLLVITASVLFFLIIIIANRGLKLYRQKRYEKFRERYSQLINSLLQGEISPREAAENLPSPSSSNGEYFMKELNGRDLDSEDREKLKELASHWGLLEHYNKLLRKGSKKEKLRAAAIMGELHVNKAAPALEKLLVETEGRSKIAAARGLARLGRIESIYPLLRNTLQEDNITFEAVTDMLINFGEQICPYILSELKKWRQSQGSHLPDISGVKDEEIISLFIDVLAHHRFRPLLTEMEKLLAEEPHPEVVIHIFKALNRMKVRLHIDLKEYLGSKNWIIRAQAAKYAGTAEIQNCEKALQYLLTDDSWWVRYYAALSLFRLGAENTLKKKAEAEGLEAVMCRFVLIENEIYEG